MSSNKTGPEKSKAPLTAERHAVVLPSFTLRDYSSFFAAGERTDARRARLMTLTASSQAHYVQQ